MCPVARGSSEGAPKVEPALEPKPRRTPAPPVAADDDLELEGDWEDVVPPPHTAPTPRPAVSSAPSSRAGAPGPAETRRGPAAGGAASAAQRERDARRAELLRGAGAGAAPKVAAASAGGGARPVLQYHRTEGAGGVLGADLAQRPWWVRAGVWLLGLGLLAGLGYGALQLTRKLRASEATLVAPDAGDSATD